MIEPGSERFATAKLSIVIPCFNEERTLATCVDRVMALASDDLEIEVVVVDDASRDRSLAIARELAAKHDEIQVLSHERNRGKGAALRTGFRAVTGDFVAVQDADLEYNPLELRGLLEPLRDGRADVVLGSRFRGHGPHRVLYYWHYVGNLFLTLLSNMLSDLNLSDMETCYKVFRREVIQSIEIREDRFGFEPEIVAKISHRGLRIYELGISYSGRTYEEGKKIHWKDGLRAFYCIFRYNFAHLPGPIRWVLYLGVGAIAASIDLLAFLALAPSGGPAAAKVSAGFAAATNSLLLAAAPAPIGFRQRAKPWVARYVAALAVAAIADVAVAVHLAELGWSPTTAKILASASWLILNFVDRGRARG